MATGIVVPSPQLQVTGANPALNLYAQPAAGLVSPPGPIPKFGPVTLSTPAPAIGARAVTGGTTPTFGSTIWFQHTLTVPTPPTFDLGLVATTTTRQIEVFNGRRSGAETLSAPVVTPAGTGVTLAPNSGVDPFALNANTSRYYTLRADTVGPVVISASIAVAGTSETVTVIATGTRMVVLAAQMDWSTGFEETVGYLTDVLDAYSDSEMRRVLRSIPRPGARFIVKALSQKETQALVSALWIGQAKQIGIPWWCDQQLPSAAINAGDTVINLDTSDRPAFVAGGLVMLWHDATTWEAVTIAPGGVGPASITLTSPVQNAYTLSDRVVGIRRGRIGAAVPLTEIVRDYAAFEISAVGDVA